MIDLQAFATARYLGTAPVTSRQATTVSPGSSGSGGRATTSLNGLVVEAARSVKNVVVWFAMNSKGLDLRPEAILDSGCIIRLHGVCDVVPNQYGCGGFFSFCHNRAFPSTARGWRSSRRLLEALLGATLNFGL